MRKKFFIASLRLARLILGAIFALLWTFSPVEGAMQKIGQGAGDYFPMYNFRVEIDGVIQAGFKEINGIESETEIIEYKDGDDMTVRKRPGRVKVGNLVLKRGFIADPKLRDWYERVVKGVTSILDSKGDTHTVE